MGICLKVCIKLVLITVGTKTFHALNDNWYLKFNNNLKNKSS